MERFDFGFDAETDGFNATKVHSLVIIDANTGAVYSCADQDGFIPIAQGVEMLECADRVIGHSILQFDIPKLSKLRGAKIDRARVLDTLLASRIAWPDLRDRDAAEGLVPLPLQGKHSLESWGYRLGIRKGAFKKFTDWQHWSVAMQDYCIQDVRVTLALYRRILAEAEVT